MHVLILGNPVDGFHFIGPFESNEDALAFAEGANGDWWVGELDPPEEL